MVARRTTAPLPLRARSAPDALALADLANRGTRLTWGQLDAMAGLWAQRLTLAGIQAGQRVAVSEPAGAAFAALLHACMRIGAVIVPLPSRAPEVERERLITQARPRAGVLRGDGELPEADRRA